MGDGPTPDGLGLGLGVVLAVDPAVSTGHTAGSLIGTSAGQSPACPSPCSWVGGPFLSSGSLYREAPSTMINMTPCHPSPHSEFSPGCAAGHPPRHPGIAPYSFGQLHVNCLHGQRFLYISVPDAWSRRSALLVQ